MVILTKLSKEKICSNQWMRQMAEEERRQSNLAKVLREKGHTCVYSLQSYPSQTVWCRNEQCTEFYRKYDF